MLLYFGGNLAWYDIDYVLFVSVIIIVLTFERFPPITFESQWKVPALLN